jgi:nitrate reductase gamma subunit
MTAQLTSWIADLGARWDSVHHAFRSADYAAVALLAAGTATLLIRRRVFA